MHAALNLRNIIREFIKQRLKHLLRPSFFSYIFLAALYLLSGFRKGYLAFSILTSSVCFLATGSIIISLLQVHIYHFKLSWSCREWSACEGSWEEVDSVTHCADQPWGIHSLCFTQSLFVIMSSHTPNKSYFHLAVGCETISHPLQVFSRSDFPENTSRSHLRTVNGRVRSSEK